MKTNLDPNPTDVRAALQDLMTWCVCTERRFYPSAEKVWDELEDAVGLWVRDFGATEINPVEVCISRHVLSRALKEMGYAPTSILDGWMLNGWLVSSPRGYIHQVRCNGVIWPCYVLSKSVWDLLEKWGQEEEVAAEKRAVAKKRAEDERRRAFSEFSPLFSAGKSAP